MAENEDDDDSWRSFLISRGVLAVVAVVVVRNCVPPGIGVEPFVLVPLVILVVVVLVVVVEVGLVLEEWVV